MFTSSVTLKTQAKVKWVNWIGEQNKQKKKHGANQNILMRLTLFTL